MVLTYFRIHMDLSRVQTDLFRSKIDIYLGSYLALELENIQETWSEWMILDILVQFLKLVEKEIFKEWFWTIFRSKWTYEGFKQTCLRSKINIWDPICTSSKQDWKWMILGLLGHFLSPSRIKYSYNCLDLYLDPNRPI